MPGKVEDEKLETDTKLQKKSSQRIQGARQVENVAKPTPGTPRSQESSAASSPSTLADLAKLDANTTNTLTHGDSRRRIDGPPRLPIDLRRHKSSIAIFAFLAYAECCFIPLGLYYGLSKGTSMRSGKSSHHTAMTSGPAADDQGQACISRSSQVCSVS